MKQQDLASQTLSEAITRTTSSSSASSTKTQHRDSLRSKQHIQRELQGLPRHIRRSSSSANRESSSRTKDSSIRTLSISVMTKSASISQSTSDICANSSLDSHQMQQHNRSARESDIYSHHRFLRAQTTSSCTKTANTRGNRMEKHSNRSA